MKISFLAAISWGLFSTGTSVLARSPVYMFLEQGELLHDTLLDQTELLHDTPDVCLPSFSAFISHMLSTSASHPMLKLQRETLDGAEAIWSRQRVRNGDMFDRNVRAGMVVIVPSVQSPEIIMPYASPAFHITDNRAGRITAMAEENVERLRAGDYGFVATLVDANIVIDSIDKTNSYSADTSMDMTASFKANFAKFNTDVFDFNLAADKTFASEVEAVRTLINKLAEESRKSSDAVDFSVVEILGLKILADAYGTGSVQYKEAQLVLRDLFEKVVIPGFHDIYADTALAVSTFVFTPAETHLYTKRDRAELSGSCYGTYQSCENATNSCSGRGECTAVQGCFVCQCKTADNVGEACQYVDVSTSFQLLFWTSVGLVLVTSGVLLFVYKSGDIENGGIMMGPQSLPKQD